MKKPKIKKDLKDHLSAIEPVGIVAVVSINTIWNKNSLVVGINQFGDENLNFTNGSNDALRLDSMSNSKWFKKNN